MASGFDSIANELKNQYDRRRRSTQSEILPTAVKSSHFAQENIRISTQEQGSATVPNNATASVTTTIREAAGANVNLSSYHIMAWQGATTLTNIIPSGSGVSATSWKVVGPFVLPYINYPLDDLPEFGSADNRLVIKTWFTNVSGGSLPLTVIVRSKYFVTTGRAVGVRVT
jgi:hypothetical protein